MSIWMAIFGPLVASMLLAFIIRADFGRWPKYTFVPAIVAVPVGLVTRSDVWSVAAWGVTLAVTMAIMWTVWDKHFKKNRYAKS